MSRMTTCLLCVLVASVLAACQSDRITCPVCSTCQTSVATSTPTPSPTPYVPPAIGAFHCIESVALFEKAVILAIDETENEHPEWFDFGGMPPIALKPDDFQKSLLDKINAKPPLKADKGWFDSWAVISVKDSNELSEDYHILSSSYVVRKKYGQTCYPATF